MYIHVYMFILVKRNVYAENAAITKSLLGLVP